MLRRSGEEEEETAGESGLVTRKAFGSFRKKTIKWSDADWIKE